MEIKYPLSESEKQYFRFRLEEVMNRKDGCQGIILIDGDKITDYYQNMCLDHVLNAVKKSGIEYAKKTNNQLLDNNL